GRRAGRGRHDHGRGHAALRVPDGRLARVQPRPRALPPRARRGEPRGALPRRGRPAGAAGEGGDRVAGRAGGAVGPPRGGRRVEPGWGGVARRSEAWQDEGATERAPGSTQTTSRVRLTFAWRAAPRPS